MARRPIKRSVLVLDGLSHAAKARGLAVSKGVAAKYLGLAGAAGGLHPFSFCVLAGSRELAQVLR